MVGIISHWERGGSKEASGVYEEVNCMSEGSDIQLELKRILHNIMEMYSINNHF